ncbi:MAG TPA: C10 family peptidase [Bacteroidales bacterium]|nr:C10 family peptidase [Bacteroidales bacterium]
MRRLIPVFLIFAFAFSVSHSQTVPVETARQVAKNIYYERANIVKPVPYKDVNFNNEYTITEYDQPVLYIYNVSQDRGFVIISAEKRTMPVLFYSFEGNYSPGVQNKNFSYWLGLFNRQIQAVRKHNIPADKTIDNIWEKYSSATITLAKDIDAVSPMVDANWGQDCYFNASCPSAPGGPCSHVYAGCVADAMAMVMKKHAWPTHGYSSHSYAHTTANGFPNNYGTLTANFGAATYNWSAMPNNVYAANSAIATLIYHCGVSVNMSYDDQGSGAMLSDAAGALRTYFIYNAEYVIRDTYSDTEWALLLKNDLDLGRPVIYGGSDTQDGGHAFVCDGYQGTGTYTSYFHFNWGWSGTSNGYIYLNNIAPDGTSFDFDDYQNIVYNIYPNTNVQTPVSDFTANKTNLEVNGIVVFTNTSTNDPLDYLWTITPGTGSSFLGSTSTTTKNAIVKFSIPGYYTISLRSTNSAGSDTEIKTNFIHVYSTAGVEENDLVKNTQIYPNPAIDIITIQTGAINASDIGLNVYDIRGNKVTEMIQSKINENDQLTMDLSNLQKGIYFITITTNDESVTRKVVLTK